MGNSLHQQQRSGWGLPENLNISALHAELSQLGSELRSATRNAQRHGEKSALLETS